MLNLETLLVALLSVLGFFVSLRISQKKKEGHPFVCPVGFECEKVVKSQYGVFLGVAVEKWGMAYYLLVFAFYSFVLFYPALLSDFWGDFFVGLSAGAFIFSAYLTFIQTFLIRTFCSYCLFSAFLSTVIFIVSFLRF